MGDTDHRKIISGIGWTYGEKTLAQGISLIVSIILARLLDPTDYGIVAIVMVFISFLDAFITGGFGNALVQKKDADELDFNTICWFSIAVSFVLYGLLYFIAPYISGFYQMEQLTVIIRVMGIKVIISAFNSVQHAYVQRHMAFKKFFFSTLGGTLVSAVCGIAMAYMGYGVWALAAQYMINAIIDTIILRITISWKPKMEWSTTRLKSMAGFGLKMLGATLVNTLQDNIRSLVIGKVFSKEDLAYYNQGKKYPSTLMNNLVGSMQKVMFPALSEQQQDRDLIRNMMRKSIRISSFIIAPVVLGMIAVADTFILLFLTEKWAPAIPYLRILSLIYLTRTLNSIFQSSLLAIGESGANLFHEIVGSVLSLALVCVGAFVFKSTLFIAWSYVAVMAIGTGIFIWFVSKCFGYTIGEIIADYVPFLLLSAVMGILVFLIGRIHINRAVLLITQFGAGLFIYFGMAKGLKIRELDTLREMLKKQ